MQKVLFLLAALSICACGRVFAFDVDIGPVHLHGAKVKVGSTIDLTIVPDKISRDEDDHDRVRNIKAHRKGDADDKFITRVVWADLDDKSKEVLKKLSTETAYEATLEKLDDDWQLLKIRVSTD
jgi:hypothetical protein